ncbi:uncharacterized protein LOC111050795 [Nilaparvata lugens]|uniref:uncharacterized protein LOC111050795 n=1 Tax=Nilaparvata lugens TaxID=108931 RepID=UPI00193DF819|nr:uncharacterized protein LOC111050795 [Nilaparvata lugens]
MEVLNFDVLKLNSCKLFAFVFLLAFFISSSEGTTIKRCYKCRSRGDQGSCKDPFKYSNFTSLTGVKGVEAIPCPSGWCNKIFEGGANQFKDEEYGAATSRGCLPRGPPDNEERCAMTVFGTNPTPVMMCLCQGDLCNGSPTTALPSALMILLPLLSIFHAWRNI